MLNFKIATVSDIPEIQKLADKIWRIHYPGIISQEQIGFMLNWMYSENSLIKQMNEDHAEFVLVFDENESIGFLSYSTKDQKNFSLHKFYIDTEKHRNGIGTAFFQNLLQRLNCPETLRLAVNRKNIKAINFYFKCGFIIERAEDFDIGNGYFMNDFVMLKTFMK